MKNFKDYIQNICPPIPRPSRMSTKFQTWDSFDSISEIAENLPESVCRSYSTISSAEVCSDNEETENASEKECLDTNNYSRKSVREKIDFHLFSDESKKKYVKLMNLERNVFVSESRREGKRKGIFAKRNIKEGEKIVLYYGERICIKERERRIRHEADMNYMVEIGRGVFIDAKGIRKGTGLTNHRCRSNSCLEARLPGKERAPIAYLRATSGQKRAVEWRKISFKNVKFWAKTSATLSGLCATCRIMEKPESVQIFARSPEKSRFQ
ncbi:MAG: SET domain-containing protein-lysine N-methyltransferase, partial [Bacteroidota bacterium]